MKKITICSVCIVCLLMLSGCTAIEDPTTGHVQYTFNPAAVQFIDTVIADANGLAPAVGTATGILFPGAVPIISAIVAMIAGISGTWLKMKQPKP